MKPIAISILIVCLFPCFGFAGQLYGNLTEGNRSVGPNVRVEIVCDGSKYTALTDNYGSYRLFVKETDKRCTLRIYYNNKESQTEVYSYANPAHYDYDLALRPDGNYEVRRR